MSDEKEITIRDLVKLQPDYLRIRGLDTPDPWLFASKEFLVRVDGDDEAIDKYYRVTDLPITIQVSHVNRRLPKNIHFHEYGDLETLMCLLAHKPEKLHIAYSYNNQSQNMERNSIYMETIRIEGTKGKRKYEVGFNTPRAGLDGVNHRRQASF